MPTQDCFAQSPPKCRSRTRPVNKVVRNPDSSCKDNRQITTSTPVASTASLAPPGHTYHPFARMHRAQNTYMSSHARKRKRPTNPSRTLVAHMCRAYSRSPTPIFTLPLLLAPARLSSRARFPYRQDFKREASLSHISCSCLKRPSPETEQCQLPTHDLAFPIRKINHLHTTRFLFSAVSIRERPSRLALPK